MHIPDKTSKPCPLCKATDIRSSKGKIRCSSCGLTLSRLTTQEAERAWNKRASDNLEELKLAMASLISRHKRFQIRWDEEDFEVSNNCVDLINK